MAVSKVGSSKLTTSATGVTSVTAALPQTPTAGNLLLLTVSLWINGTTGPTWTDPTGWTLAVNKQETPLLKVQEVRVYYRVATGSETNPTVSSGGSAAGNFHCIAEEWSGLAVTSPLDATNSATVGATNGSVTLTNGTANDWCYSAYIDNGTNTDTVTWSSGTSNASNADTNQSAVYTATATASGTSQTFTVSNTSGSGDTALVAASFKVSTSTLVGATASISLSGTAAAGTQATGAISLSGSGVAGTKATGSLSLSGSLVSTANDTGAGSLSLSGTAAAGTQGTGSISLSGSGQWVQTASGSISLSGTAAAGTQGTGSLVLTATGAWSDPGAGSISLSASAWWYTQGTGALSLSGTSTAGAGATSTGSISLSGSAVPQFGAGSLSLSGSGSSTANITAGGSINLAATASASGGSPGTGTLSLSGTAFWIEAMSGSLSLSGTGQWVTSSSGAISLSANPPAAAAGVATGSGGLGLSGISLAAGMANSTASITFRVVPVAYTRSPRPFPFAATMGRILWSANLVNWNTNMPASIVTLYTGTTQYLPVLISGPVPLGTQPVWISLDKVNWLPATWQSAAGYQMGQIYFMPAEILVGPGTNPPLPAAGTGSPVWVKVQDNPEMPVMNAGAVYIANN